MEREIFVFDIDIYIIKDHVPDIQSIPLCAILSFIFIIGRFTVSNTIGFMRHNSVRIGYRGLDPKSGDRFFKLYLAIDYLYGRSPEAIYIV